MFVKVVTVTVHGPDRGVVFQAVQAVNLSHDAAHAQMDVKFHSHLLWLQVRPTVTLMFLLLHIVSDKCVVFKRNI